MATVEDLIDVELTQLGYTEQPPGSNQTKFGDLFFPGQPAAWCAAFQSWAPESDRLSVAADQLGIRAGRPLGRLPEGPGSEAWVVATGRPQRGDLVCFEWEEDLA